MSLHAKSVDFADSNSSDGNDEQYEMDKSDGSSFAASSDEGLKDSDPAVDELEDFEESETRDTNMDDGQTFQSQVSIPALNKRITVTASHNMTFDEYLKAINDRLSHINLPDSFKIGDFRLFNPEKSRWIDTRVPYIRDAGLQLTDPNVFLIKSHVDINVVLPNLQMMKVTVRSDEIVLRTIKYICGLLGITNRYEEFALVENVENRSFQNITTYEQHELDKVEDIFSELCFPEKIAITDYAIPATNSMKFRNRLTFGRLTLWLSLTEQGVVDGDTFYLRNVNFFVSKGTTNDRNRFNAILAQAYSDFQSGIFDLSGNDFLNSSMGAFFSMLRHYQGLENKAKKLNPLAVVKKPLNIFKNAVKFLVSYQNLSPTMNANVVHHCLIVEGMRGKKPLNLSKDGNQCELAVEGHRLKIKVDAKESIDTVFDIFESQIELTSKIRKVGKNKEKQFLLKVTSQEFVMFLKFSDPSNTDLTNAYLDICFTQARKTIKPLYYNPVFMHEFVEDRLKYLTGAIPTQIRGHTSLVVDQTIAGECIPRTLKSSDVEKYKNALMECMRLISRDTDSTATLTQKTLTFINFTKSFNKLHIYSEMALETFNDQKALLARYKAMSADKATINPEIVSYSLEVEFDHFVVIPSLTKKQAERAPSRICLPLTGILVWKMKPMIGIDISVDPKFSGNLERLIDVLELKSTENRNGVAIYELKIEVSKTRSPYTAHELLTSVRFYRQVQDNGKNVIRDKDEGYLSSGLTQHKVRTYKNQMVKT